MAVVTRDDAAWGSHDGEQPTPLVLPADLPVTRILAWAGAVVAGALFWAGVGLAVSLVV